MKELYERGRCEAVGRADWERRWCARGVAVAEMDPDPVAEAGEPRCRPAEGDNWISEEVDNLLLLPLVTCSGQSFGTGGSVLRCL